MLAELDSYDWREAFKYATQPNAVVNSSAREDPCSIDDVAEVIATSDGENDGASWIGVFRMEDGRYLSLRAWCDYTGWG